MNMEIRYVADAHRRDLIREAEKTRLNRSFLDILRKPRETENQPNSKSPAK